MKYTHAKDVILHTSTKVDDSLRYLTLHENRYIRYFRGHEKKDFLMHFNFIMIRLLVRQVFFRPYFFDFIDFKNIFNF